MFLTLKQLIFSVIALSLVSSGSAACISTAKHQIFELMLGMNGNKYSSQSLKEARRELKRNIAECPSVKAGFYVRMYGFIDPVYIDILANDLVSLKRDVHGTMPRYTQDVSFTPLHFAAGYGTTAAMLVLIKKGARINSPDSNGNPPLLDAVSSNVTPLKKTTVLVKAGADVNLHGSNIWNALGYAVAKKRYKIARYLLEHKGCVFFGAQRVTAARIKNASAVLGLDIKDRYCHALAL